MVGTINFERMGLIDAYPEGFRVTGGRIVVRQLPRPPENSTASA